MSVRRTNLTPDAAEAQTRGGSNRRFVGYLKSESYQQLKAVRALPIPVDDDDDESVDFSSDLEDLEPPRKRQRRD